MVYGCVTSPIESPCNEPYDSHIVYSVGDSRTLYRWVGLAKDARASLNFEVAIKHNIVYLTKSQYDQSILKDYIEVSRAIEFFNDNGVITKTKQTDFYFTSEEAVKALRFYDGEVWVEKFKLIMAKPQLSAYHEVIMYPGRNGGYYCNISSHPELDGYRAKGKIFFPISDWKDVTSGKARVEIVGENANYGKVRGVMCPDRSPTLSEVLSYCKGKYNSFSFLECLKYPDGRMRYFLRTCGTASTLSHTITEFYIEGFSGNFSLRLLSNKTNAHIDSNVKRFSDILLIYYAMDAYKLKRSDAYAIWDSFIESAYFKQSYLTVYLKARSTWYRDNSCPGVDNLFNKCLKDGIIHSYSSTELPGVRIYTLPIHNYARLLHLSYTDFMAVSKTFSRLNELADEHISNRKGGG